MYRRTPIHSSDPALVKTVGAIGEEVRKKGDSALFAMAQKFDHVRLATLVVSEEEFRDAVRAVDAPLKRAIQTAIRNVRTYHAHQLPYLKQSPVHTMEGIKCYRKFSAIERVGVYIPGGSAPLFSSVLMTVIPAKLAGCREIILCTPPNAEGKIANEILYTAHALGCRQVYKVGGAQAIFAMAYGTPTIAAVEKIVGPGNQYVNEAKQQIARFMPIDMPAGPSEVMVIADDTASAAVISRDLLAQLEHDPNAQALLLVYSQKMLREVQKTLAKMVEQAVRKAILMQSLNHLKTQVVRSSDEAIQLANAYAPEHLIIATKDATKLSKRIVHAGSVFVGYWAAESIGDYASGTNHTLPTSGYAKNYSGLSVESFGKWTSFQEISRRGFERIAQTVKMMSEKEGLFEHKNSIVEREQVLKK